MRLGGKYWAILELFDQRIRRLEQMASYHRLKENRNGQQTTLQILSGDVLKSGPKRRGPVRGSRTLVRTRRVK